MFSECIQLPLLVIRTQKPVAGISALSFPAFSLAGHVNSYVLASLPLLVQTTKSRDHPAHYWEDEWPLRV